MTTGRMTPPGTNNLQGEGRGIDSVSTLHVFVQIHYWFKLLFLVIFVSKLFILKKPNAAYNILSVPDEDYSSNVPDEDYSSNVPDEDYSSNVPDEDYWAYLMKIIPVTYLMKIIERTWWRLFQ